MDIYLVPMFHNHSPELVWWFFHSVIDSLRSGVGTIFAIVQAWSSYAGTDAFNLLRFTVKLEKQLNDEIPSVLISKFKWWFKFVSFFLRSPATKSIYTISVVCSHRQSYLAGHHCKVDSLLPVKSMPDPLLRSFLSVSFFSFSFY